MLNAVGYFNILIIPALASWALGRGNLAFFSVIAIVFFLHPLLDFGVNRFAPKSIFKIEPSKSHLLHRIPVYLFFPIQFVLVFYAFQLGSQTVWTAIQSGILCGISGGIYGIASAHELFHSARRIEGLLSQAILCFIGYPHFGVEHQLHHIHIGTTQDSETAKRDESIYQFWIRSTLQGFQKSIHFQKTRVVSVLVVTMSILALLFLQGKDAAAIIFIVQSVTTILLLKWVDYVEHYGANRKGKILAIHSWDCTQVVSNWYLFNLGFHSRHHLEPRTPYESLPEVKHKWNELPYGYSTMVLFSLWPEYWKRLMNPRLDQILLTSEAIDCPVIPGLALNLNSPELPLKESAS